ncbi:MAG: hypothetical protein ACXV49_06835 [Halobacteriota archaeon]
MASNATVRARKLFYTHARLSAHTTRRAVELAALGTLLQTMEYPLR